MKTISIEEIEAKQASDDELTDLNALYQVIESEIHPNDRPEPAGEFIAWTRAEPEHAQTRYWLIRDGARVVAASYVEYEWEAGNPHLVFMEAEVHPEYRRRGLGGKILEPAVVRAKADGKTLISAFVSETAGGPEFSKSLGAKKSVREIENRLVLEDVDPDLLDQWVENARERASEYELIFWEGPTSADLLPGFARVRDAMNDAPMPEGWNDFVHSAERTAETELRQYEAGLQFWTTAAVHKPTGEIGGFTRVFPNLWRPEFVAQDDTGVLPKHRNKGLGRWVKADMLIRVLERLPGAKFINTENDSTNKAMLSINNALGFKPYHFVQNWQIATDDLAAKLGVG